MQQVATLSEIEDGGMKGVEIGDTSILLLRDGDVVRAVSGKCPHAGAPLADGARCQGRIVCPWHKAMFSDDDGGLLEPPALDALRRFPVQVVGDAVLVSPEPIARRAAAPRDQDRHVLIVGSGAAGTAAVAALRDAGFAGRITMLGAESGAPYDRTILSKFVLDGSKTPDEAPLLRPADFWTKARVDRREHRAVRLDAAARTVTLENGDILTFDMALVATGGIPRPLDLPGAGLRGVHLLRSRADAAAILSDLGDARPPVVVVGGSFIGLEAASGLRKQGCAVTVVVPHAVPFEKQLGAEIGAMIRRLHEDEGVVFQIGEVERFEGENRVAAAVLKNGIRLHAGLVVAGIGVSPATELLENLPLEPDGGVAVDHSMRTATAGVFAAGDIASFPFGKGRVRVEHWRVAQQQARVAVRAMLGDDARFDQAPFFWTAQHGKRFEVHGHPAGFDRVEIEGDLDRQDFLARQWRGDELVGLVACGRDAETAALAPSMPFRP
ncbi:FAD-dependent oxidoreductase [Rhizosaccharibacter radicis]|uniref:FAD-dependent oxidoreductase n=1 Tax=Rhizosaccharibacter radicis TaxID=2782605 RepID=A0ABT1VX13_9PROT|nr:FAD-dependent oxidoreductase [Acetobacteraceae bacterium KSS12]